MSVQELHYVSLPDAEELRLSLDALHQGQEKMSLTIVELATTLRHMAAIQEKQSDYGEKLVGLRSELNQAKEDIKEANQTASNIQLERKTDLKWVWGIIVTLASGLLFLALPHLRWH